MEEIFGNTGYRKCELLETLHRLCIEKILTSTDEETIEDIKRLDAIYNHISQSHV